MGSSMTPLAPDDAPEPPAPGSARPGALSPGLLVAVKVVLGVAGFAAFALLGAGGALLIKHLLGSDSRSATPAALVAPTARPSPAPVAPSTALPVVPVAPAQAVVALPEPSGTSLALPAAASAPSAQDSGAAIQAPTETARLARLPASPRTEGKPRRGIGPEGGTTSMAADKANCLATLNAVTADVSLRNEPPTPQQLAILKRGCK